MAKLEKMNDAYAPSLVGQMPLLLEALCWTTCRQQTVTYRAHVIALAAASGGHDCDAKKALPYSVYASTSLLLSSLDSAGMQPQMQHVESGNHMTGDMQDMQDEEHMTARDGQDRTALMHAAAAGSSDCVRLLLDEASWRQHIFGSDGHGGPLLSILPKQSTSTGQKLLIGVFEVLRHAGAMTAAIEGGDLSMAVSTSKTAKIQKLARFSCIYQLLKAKCGLTAFQHAKLSGSMPVAAASIPSGMHEVRTFLRMQKCPTFKLACEAIVRCNVFVHLLAADASHFLRTPQTLLQLNAVTALASLGKYVPYQDVLDKLDELLNNGEITSCQYCSMQGRWSTCSLCNAVAYCSKSCQKKAWPSHKLSCVGSATAV
ncbi:hypothetical protein MMC07_000382 [Pseudocyphellaria aurata]|nr:hypothetical protein [Pseudocyphellaria aurata]